MITSRTMRWHERRCRYLRTSDPIDTRQFAVDILATARAARFIARHHYLVTMPATQLCVGLFGPKTQDDDPPLAGVAVFAVPSNPAVITRHAGLPPAQGTTLARFILLDEVPANGETHFLRKAFSLLRREKPHLETVVSYADPLAGHIGHIYAAASAAHRGRTRPRSCWSLSGTTIPGRTLSKIANEESGHKAAIDRLIAMGARKPEPAEAPPDWLKCLKSERVLERSLHPGCFVYNFALTRRAKNRSRALPSQPYPTFAALFQPLQGPLP